MGEISFSAAFLLLLITTVSAQTWPDCAGYGADFEGDAIRLGHRFSREECSEWCDYENSVKGLPDYCKVWIYKEKDHMCHLLNTIESSRNIDMPLTQADKDEFSLTGPVEVNGTTTTTTPRPEVQIRWDERVEELNMTHYGWANCTNDPAGKNSYH